MAFGRSFDGGALHVAVLGPCLDVLKVQGTNDLPDFAIFRPVAGSVADDPSEFDSASAPIRHTWNDCTGVRDCVGPGRVPT